MVVVADSSPLHYLLLIGQIEILPALFQRIVIPPEVQRELAHASAPQIMREFIARVPAWLTVVSPTSVETIPEIDAGERAAINLARELHADLLLIDDFAGREAAAQRGIAIIGTIGVLEVAATRSLLDLPTVIDRIRETTFRVSDELLDDVLRRHRQRASRE